MTEEKVTKTRTRTSPAAEVATPAKPEEAQRWGVLVRGRVYYYREKIFEQGVPKPVTAEEELWLDEHAVDEVTVEDEFEHQPRKKFRFADTLERLEVPQGSPPARARQ
jgi:hypothetical protein